MSEIINKTIKGNCSNCGECCMNFIPLSHKELKNIKRYVKKNNIREIMHTLPLTGKTLDLTCPFRDNINNKCVIYPVRPLICKQFICNKNCNKMKDMLLYRHGMIDLRKEVFGHDIGDEIMNYIGEDINIINKVYDNLD